MGAVKIDPGSSATIGRSVSRRWPSGAEQRLQLQFPNQPVQVVYMDAEPPSGLAVIPQSLLHDRANNLALRVANRMMISVINCRSDHSLWQIFGKDFFRGSE